MASHTPGAFNSALTPILQNDRVFGGAAHASLWFSLGVGLLVMQMGAYLLPGLGTQDALLVIVLGSVIGSALLAWTARLGALSGLSSAGIMHHTYGSAFAKLPIVLNIVQLVGWTTFELVVMSEGSTAIGQQALGLALEPATSKLLTTLLWGTVLVALLAGSMVTLVRRFVARVGLPLVVASLLWLSWQFAGQVHTQGWPAFWQRSGDGSMGLASGLDLVIAMPVSWLPLVADYARYGKNGKGAFWGTWLGYALANVWCYALGVLVMTVATPDSALVTALLLAQGGLLALGLILIDELDNAYGDAHSAAVSLHSLRPRWNIRLWGMGMAAVCTVLALYLPMHSLEPFLITLSSVFVPLYGVILGRLGGTRGLLPAATRRVNWLAAGLWLLGIAVYQGLAHWAPQYGAALPTLALTWVLAYLSRRSCAPGVGSAA